MPEYLFGVNVINICCAVDVLTIFFSNSSPAFKCGILSLSNFGWHETKEKDSPLYDLRYEFEMGTFKIIMLTGKKDSIMKIKLYQPTKGSQDMFIPIIKKHNQIPKINQIEIPIDFYVADKEDAALLQDRIDKYLFQTYQHGKSKIYKNDKDDSHTLYTSFIAEDCHTDFNNRNKYNRLSRFSKCYCRLNEGKKHDKGILPLPSVRLELTLNASILKKYIWPFPILQENISSVDILKYQRFCRFDFAKFDKFLLNPKKKNDPRRQDIEKKSRLTARQYCRSIKDQRILEICEFLKKIPALNHNRFLVPLTEENKIIQKGIETCFTGYDVPFSHPFRNPINIVVPKRRLIIHPINPPINSVVPKRRRSLIP